MLEKSVLNSYTAFSEVKLVLHAEAGWLRSLAMSNTNLSYRLPVHFFSARESSGRLFSCLKEYEDKLSSNCMFSLVSIAQAGNHLMLLPGAVYTAIYCQHTRTQEVLGTQVWEIPSERNTFPRQLQLLKQTAHRWVSSTHITYQTVQW